MGQRPDAVAALLGVIPARGFVFETAAIFTLPDAPLFIRSEFRKEQTAAQKQNQNGWHWGFAVPEIYF